MEITTNINKIINFEKSDLQLLLELLMDLGVVDRKGIFQEGSIEIEGNLNAKPTLLLTDFLFKPQDALYSKADIEKKAAFSLWDLYKETNDLNTSRFQIVGSSALHSLGYENLVAQLKKLKIKKTRQSLWDLLPLSVQLALKERCHKRGNDVDVRVQQIKEEYFEHALDKVDQFLIKKIEPSSPSFFFQNFYKNRHGISKENTFWTIQSFYYGNTTIDYCQFVKAPRTYRFIKEALLLEVDLNKKQVELKTENPLILIQSLLDVILKISHSDLKNVIENNDLGILVYNQSCFHTCSREEDEENLIQHIFKENNKEANTLLLEKILDTAYTKHANKNLSSLVCLLLNALRICAPHIDEKQLIVTMHQQLIFSKHTTHIHTLCTMLLEKIEFEKISSVVQVVAFAALHHKVFIDKKKICLVKHREVEHLQIGNENSILFKWDIHKSLNVISEHFDSLSRFFSSCLLGLTEPLNLSEHEIFFIAAHEAGQFELAFKKFSLLNRKSKALLGRVFSNPHIPNEQKFIHLSRAFSKKCNEQAKSLLLSELNTVASNKEILAPLPHSIIQHLLSTKDSMLYPHLISMIPLEKIHFIWKQEFQNIKDTQQKLLFFINAIEVYHQFKIPHSLEAMTLSNPCKTSTPFKIETNSSYIHTLCEMLLKSIDLEKISASIQVVFFVSMHASSSKPILPPKALEVIQIGEENGFFIKWDIKKAIRVVKKYFETLSFFLPLLHEKKEPPLSPSEILFIAAQEAGEFKCSLKIFRNIKGSQIIAKGLASNPNIPIKDKILYLLEILKLKTSNDLPFLLESLNKFLKQIKKHPPLDLQEECIQHIWNNKKEYSHILLFIPSETLQKLCASEFNLIKGVKNKFNFIIKEIEFYEKFNITFDLSPLVVPLYKELIKNSLPHEAAQLRSFFKNRKEIQSKMPLPLEIKSKKKASLIKNNYFENVKSLNVLLESKKEDFFKGQDEALSLLFPKISAKSLREINWKKLKGYLKNLPKTNLSLDNRLYTLSFQFSNVHEIGLLQYHSDNKKILLETARRLKNNLILSKKCFQVICQDNVSSSLEVDLREFFGAYTDVDSLLWLLHYLPKIVLHFPSMGQEVFLNTLNELGNQLQLTLKEPNHIQICFQWLFKHAIWTPSLAECFSVLYKKLMNKKQIFIEPKKKNYYEKLLQNISSIKFLDRLIPLCFPDDDSMFQKAPHFIDRLNYLLEKSPELKESRYFIHMQDTLLNYLRNAFSNFLKKGANRHAWHTFIHQCAHLFLYLQQTPQEETLKIMSESVLICALFEKDLNFFNELCRLVIKNLDKDETAHFFYQLLCKVTFYIYSNDTQCHLKRYQSINKTPFKNDRVLQDFNSEKINFVPCQFNILNKSNPRSLIGLTIKQPPLLNLMKFFIQD